MACLSPMERALKLREMSRRTPDLALRDLDFANEIGLDFTELGIWERLRVLADEALAALKVDEVIALQEWERQHQIVRSPTSDDEGLPR